MLFCFLAAVAVLCGSVAAAWLLRKQKKEGRQTLPPLNVLFGGVLVAAVLLFLPAYTNQEMNDAFQVIKALAFSLYSAIRLFAADGDYEVILENIGGGELAHWYQLLASVLMVMAPALTFGAVLSFFNNVSANVAYILAYFKDVYVFSDLNERSLTLAADIRKNHPDAAVAFAAVPEEEEGEIQDRARSMGAMCFKKDILSVRFGFHAKSKGLWFFNISEDQDANVLGALRLLEIYGDRPNTNLFVFATGVESEALLTSAQNRAMRVRRVDEVHSRINRLLYEEGHLLFDPSLPEVDGEKQITALVVGMGSHGTAMVKALSWFCQMDGYRVTVHGFDRDPLAEEKFSALCPELMDETHNGTNTPGDAHYQIHIHGDTCVESKGFADRIHRLKDASYVLVALGDDGLNIRTAMELRVLFEQVGAKPRIQAIVYSSEKRAALAGLKNFKGQPYSIDFIGDMESSYTEAVILESELEEDALRRHLRWGKESEFWGYEYNYRSSIALAIHSRAKQKVGIAGANKAEEELTDGERLALEDLEHRRWNAYMRSQGYIYSGSTDKRSRNDLGRMHHDLIAYADLSEEEKRKDSKVASK